MQGTIQTPTAIWKDCEIVENIVSKEVEKTIYGDITVTKLYIEKNISSIDNASIFVKLYERKGENLPIIVLVQEFGDYSEYIPTDLVNRGYNVLVVDLGGKLEDGHAEFYTKYPDSLAFCNFNEESYNRIEIEGDIKDTFWYYWAYNLKVAIKFARENLKAENVSLFGIGKSATSVWHVLATEKITSAVIVNNCGWQGYKDYDKFDNVVEPQFDDDRLRFIAGVDPEAYAMHVSCPVLVVSATNSCEFNIDRAYDTISKISEKCYSAIDYSIGFVNNINSECYQDIICFFNHFCLNANSVLPQELSVKGEIKNGQLIIEVVPFLDGLKELSVFVAEESVKPQYRSYRKIIDIDQEKNGKYYFKYTPYYGSKRCFFFARAKYKCGISICSNIVCNTFEREEIAESFKFKILYSTRLKESDSSFTAIEDLSKLPKCVDMPTYSELTVKQGVMNNYGISCDRGIRTFKVMAEKFKPLDNSILMLDVCSKESVSLSVKLIENFFGEKKEYIASVQTLDGIWQNVKFEMNNFKTKDGFPLRSYKMIEAIEFVSDGEVILNNILWI